MGDAVGWWAKKLGTERPPAPSTPDTWNLPRHTPPTPAHQQTQQSYVPPANALMADENGQVHMGEAIMYWRGGEGTYKETAHCPKCRSSNYFSRQSEAKVTQNGMAAPAPQCFNCGFNGLYTPFGGALNDMAG
jgi:hypothetical protein